MGGVDLSDMLLELYRINFKSKKWYMHIFYYLLDLSVVNAWLLYHRMMSQSTSNNILHLCNFKEEISDGLIKQAAIKKRRPKLNSLESTPKRNTME